MWPSWAKLPHGRLPAAAAASPPTLSRSSFSFKDLHALLADTDPAPIPNKKLPAAVCHRTRSASSALRSFRSHSQPSSPPSPSSDDHHRIVVYFTSLRAIRSTFDDCRAVRTILHSLRVAVDERDLAMDASFLAELKLLLGRRPLALPKVFIAGRYAGGADEIRTLHESGDLKKIVDGFPAAAACGGVCDACGGMGFVLCLYCSGSHRRYSGKGGGFRTCTACNENGLVRCSDCSLPGI